MEAGSLAIEMRAITKRFPGVLANDAVDFDLRPGEIHALLGENGAGKSTLMNVLTGLYRPDQGGIWVQGQAVAFNSPRDAINRGIGMVHQHFMLVPTQTVTENVLLGLDKPAFFIDLPQCDKVIADLARQYGLEVDPRAKIWQLSVGEQQRVEILKMLYRGVQVLIMDEPTAVLAPQEILQLFDTLRSMVAGGKSVIFISHKLDEVMRIADRVTVLRKGCVTAAGLTAAETNKEKLARLMVGREVLFRLEKNEQPAGSPVLEIENLAATNDRGLPALRGVSLHVCRGEIVGLAGIAGNGQAELAEVVTGIRPATGGCVRIHGEAMVGEGSRGGEERRVRQVIDAGVSYVPADRAAVGTAPNLSVTDNLILKAYRKPPISRGWSIDRTAAHDRAEELRTEYDIMVPTVETSARLLSGGNLQRVILAREISARPKLMVAMQPTRGLDVGAIEGVQRLLLEQRQAGAAVLLVSEELEELMSLSDRIYVIHRGEIMGEVREAEAAQLGMMMTGTRLAEIEAGGRPVR
ncbi:MAG: heme ABC transporter ATP-binding protein [Chloroflexi bacterium RBG_13_68_17]|jgi:simple sugar transport system ATP-binding protein|nr:MAG: heme ABC transporter ATP-binding protein [Chloroflexi bacterium RBG_13_68_17]